MSVVARYSIKYNELKNHAVALQNIGKTLASFENRLYSITASMDTRDSSMESLKRQILAAGKNLPVISGKLASAGTAAENISNIYSLAEKYSYSSFENSVPWAAAQALPAVTGQAQSVFDPAASGAGFPGVAAGSAGVAAAGSASLLGEHLDEDTAVNSILNPFGLSKVEYGKYDDKKKFKEIEQEDRTFWQQAYERDTGQMVIPDLAPKNARKLATIYSVGTEAKAEYAWREYKASGKTDWAEGSAELKVAAAEAHAELSAGLYVFDKNGNKRFAPGVEAAVGASFSALAASAEGKIGNDMLGAFGEAELEIAKAEAEGKLKLSLFDKDGKLDIDAHAEASLEAVAFEVGGKAGVSVLGTDVAVKGEFKVGVGVHAEVGYADGVFKFDVGASLGIGASIGFEVDVSGTVDAICSKAEAAWDAIKGWF